MDRQTRKTADCGIRETTRGTYQLHPRNAPGAAGIARGDQRGMRMVVPEKRARQKQRFIRGSFIWVATKQSAVVIDLFK